MDSDSELVSSNVLSPEEGSVAAHSRFDLESLSVTNWVWWVLEWMLWLLVDEPGLVGTVVALVPDEIVVVSILGTSDIKAASGSSGQTESIVLDVSSVSSFPVDSLPELVSVDSSDSIGILDSSLVSLW